MKVCIAALVAIIVSCVCDYFVYGIIRDEMCDMRRDVSNLRNTTIPEINDSLSRVMNDIGKLYNGHSASRLADDVAQIRSTIRFGVILFAEDRGVLSDLVPAIVDDDLKSFADRLRKMNMGDLVSDKVWALDPTSSDTKVQRKEIVYLLELADRIGARADEKSELLSRYGDVVRAYGADTVRLESAKVVAYLFGIPSTEPVR